MAKIKGLISDVDPITVGLLNVIGEPMSMKLNMHVQFYHQLQHDSVFKGQVSSVMVNLGI